MRYLFNLNYYFEIKKKINANSFSNIFICYLYFIMKTLSKKKLNNQSKN
jgi:hypothetical protein